ncbi:MAG: efflux RND transporter permease subunit, partial [Acidobacteriota bacterium]
IERTARALEVEVSASTPERLAALEDRVRRSLEAGGWRVEADRDGGRRPAWWLRFDDARLARLGADADPLRRQLRAGLEPRALGRTRIDGVEPDILFDAGDELTRSGAAAARLPIAVGGRIVPLGAVADLRTEGLEPPLERRAGRPTARLAVAGGPAEAEAIERHLAVDVTDRAADWEIRLAGLTHELRRSFSQLRLALGLALVLVFLTVAALYESLRLPLVVMTTVPTAAAGAVVALLAGGESFNVMSFLGLIVLTGLVVNNALVLLHRAEQHRAGGAPVRTAIADAAGERYRPILMTTVTTLLGMVPLALLGGDGVELRRSLAVAVSGGLVTSWAASLVVVPAFYQLLLGGRRADG